MASVTSSRANERTSAGNLKAVCDINTICDILDYANVIMLEPVVSDAMLRAFAHLMATTTMDVCMLACKKIMLDMDMQPRPFLKSIYSTFIEAVSSKNPRSMLPTELEQLKFLLSGIALNYEPIFYSPVIMCVKSEDQESLCKHLRVCTFLCDVIGELKFWFGAEGWHPDGSMMSVKSEGSGKDKRLAAPNIKPAYVKPKIKN